MKHEPMTGNIIKTKKPNFYCAKKGDTIQYTKVEINRQHAYTNATTNETLNAMRKNLIASRNEIDSMLKLVEESLKSINQQKLF